MIPRIRNLFPAPAPGDAEETHLLRQAPGFRLEHLVSHGHPSPPGFWYDPYEEEWVVLLRGTAILDFGEDGKLELVAGDSLKIPARARHRLERVSEDAVWIALHLSKE